MSLGMVLDEHTIDEGLVLTRVYTYQDVGTLTLYAMLCASTSAMTMIHDVVRGVIHTCYAYVYTYVVRCANLPRLCYCVNYPNICPM